MRSLSGRLIVLAAALAGGVGCRHHAAEDPATGEVVVGRPGAARGDRSSSKVSPRSASRPEVSWDTEDDRRFARFLQQNSGGMIARAAVGLARKGVLRVVLDASVAPEDTLPLTRSLLEGARRDFPGRPITLTVYDPAEAPILTARYRPGQGVDYQLAGSDQALPEPDRTATAAPAPRAEGPPRQGGVTGRDREFARWAERTGGEYLRYVQADLERHGRLWFGVTRETAPGDVPELTRSLLEGARSEFPKRSLRATVFDPEGERIGTATLGPDGEVRWVR